LGITNRSRQHHIIILGHWHFPLINGSVFEIGVGRRYQGLNREHDLA
jgi:hypothetical protein